MFEVRGRNGAIVRNEANLQGSPQRDREFAGGHDLDFPLRALRASVVRDHAKRTQFDGVECAKRTQKAVVSSR